jgi:hypothetical protein
MRFFKPLAVASFALLLAACSGKGLDRKLETEKGPDAYKASLAEAGKDMTEDDGGV